MLRHVAVCVVVGIAGGCATMFAHDAETPSSTDEWKLYVKRWAKPTERAVLVHTNEAWACDAVAVKPVGYGASVDDAGARTPYLEWSAMGCGKDAHYEVRCTSANAGAHKARCDVARKRVVMAGLPSSFAPDEAIVVVDDDARSALQ